MAVWNLFLASILLPLVTIALLAIRGPRPLGGWVSTFVLSLGVTGFSVLAAPWGWFGIPLRFAIALLFITAAIVSLRRAVPAEIAPESPLRMMLKIVIGLFFGSVGVGVLSAHAVPGRAVDVGFPLRGGTYLVAHGGSTSAANLHAQHPAQRYAVDIEKLNGAGMRARGLYPVELTRYAIYGATVVSPCDGIVVTALDGLPDNAPPLRDEKNTAGNHAIIRCSAVDVWLAHLQRGSVGVRAGTPITRGAIVGRVGSSGNATEPHLHVHGQRDGIAVPLRFDGRWLVRNAIVRAAGSQ